MGERMIRKYLAVLIFQIFILSCNPQNEDKKDGNRIDQAIQFEMSVDKGGDGVVDSLVNDRKLNDALTPDSKDSSSDTNQIGDQKLDVQTKDLGQGDSATNSDGKSQPKIDVSVNDGHSPKIDSNLDQYVVVDKQTSKIDAIKHDSANHNDGATTTADLLSTDLNNGSMKLFGRVSTASFVKSKNIVLAESGFESNGVSCNLSKSICIIGGVHP